MAEKISAFYKMLNSLEGKDYIETFLFYNVALISTKVKPSITLSLCKLNCKNIFTLWNEFGIDYLKTLNLDYVELRESEKSLIVLIYNKDLLTKCINKDQNTRFLQSIGYEKSESIHNTLQTLKDRYKIYKCPHELGVFLGFPIEDVKDFMNCSNKKCLLCGYWKVYNNENEAKKIFKLYDNIREFTVENIIKFKCENQFSLRIDNFFEYDLCKVKI